MTTIISSDELLHVTGGKAGGATAVGNSINIQGSEGDRFAGYNACRDREAAQANQEVGKARHWLADHVFGVGQASINAEVRAKQSAACDWMKPRTR